MAHRLQICNKIVHHLLSKFKFTSTKVLFIYLKSYTQVWYREGMVNDPTVPKTPTGTQGVKID